MEEKIKFLTKKYERTPEIVLEATGVYSRPIERFFQDHEYSYYLVNPLEANYQTKSLRRNKTDKSDAHELAKSHFKVERREKFHQDDYYENMRVMSRHYNDIGEEKNLYKNKLHALLQLSFPEMEVIFKSKSTLFYNIIQILPHPDTLLNSSKTIVRNRLKKCTNKNYSLKKLDERAIQLIEATYESYPAIDADDYQCELIKKYARKILDMDREQIQLIDEMATMSEGTREFKVLLSIPGIQKNTACRLIGELGDLRRFKNNKQLNA